MFDMLQQLFMKKKILNKLGIERNSLNKIKIIYEKSTANIIINDERLKAFSVRSETK